MSVFANPTLAPSQRGFGGLRMLCDDVFEESGTWFADDPPHNMDVMDVVVAGALQYRDEQDNLCLVGRGETMVCQSGSAMRLHTQAQNQDTRRIRLGWQSHTVNAAPNKPRMMLLSDAPVSLTLQPIASETMAAYLVHGEAQTPCGQIIKAHDWVANANVHASTHTEPNNQWLLVPTRWA